MLIDRGKTRRSHEIWRHAGTMQTMTKTAIITLLAVAINLVACTQPSPTARPQTTVPTLTPRPSSTPTSIPTPTPSPTPTLSPTATASPTPTTPPPTSTQNPACGWALLQDFSTQPNGVMTVEILPRGTATFVGLGSGGPIEMSTLQVDLLVIDTGYARPWYSVDLQMSGLGTDRSWFVEMGYHGEDGHLGVHCHAYSYSRPDTGDFWQEVERPVGFQEWHTFKIEVVPTGKGWQYAFRYLLDGEDVCYYQPPDRWDGDNSYNVLQRGVEIWVDGCVPPQSPSIRVLVDDLYGY